MYVFILQVTLTSANNVLGGSGVLKPDIRSYAQLIPLP